MREALSKVKADLGPDAVIHATRRLPPSSSDPAHVFEVTAAPAMPFGAAPAAPRTRIAASGKQASAASPPARRPSAAGPANSREPGGASRAQVQPWRFPAVENGTPATALPAGEVPAFPDQAYPYYLQLVQNEVAERLAADIVARAAAASGTASAAAVRATLQQTIAQMIPIGGGITLKPGACTKVALIGPPGAGKTTTLAKLAAQFQLRQGRRVGILSLDTHRLGTHDQVRRYAELIGVPVFTTQTVSATREALGRMGGIELLLVDTPGVSGREHGRFTRLAALLRAVRADEVHLVLPVSTSGPVLQRFAAVFGKLGVTRLVLSRLDEAVGLGVVLNTIRRLDWAISYLTCGQNVPRDIEEACGDRMAELLCSAPS